MQQQHSNNWIEYFSQQGYTNVKPLASGMEGAVYRLEEGIVGKVWANKEPSDLIGLQEFYRDLEYSSLSFSTPLIDQILDVGGTTVTIERELKGTQLEESVDKDGRIPFDKAWRSTLSVLRELRTVEARPSMRAMRVLDMKGAFWTGKQNWSDAILELMMTRVERFGDQLRNAVPGFETKLSRIIKEIQKLDSPEETVIHGDLCGVNVLVDEDFRPTAVLDFGFLTTAGDPAFDAAISAAIFNMYGGHAEEIAEQLTALFAKELGYTEQRLRVYQAAYAVITSNAYDPNGKDGHFAWCANILRKSKVV